MEKKVFFNENMKVKEVVFLVILSFIIIFISEFDRFKEAVTTNSGMIYYGIMSIIFCGIIFFVIKDLYKKVSIDPNGEVAIPPNKSVYEFIPDTYSYKAGSRSSIIGYIYNFKKSNIKKAYVIVDPNERDIVKENMKKGIPISAGLSLKRRNAFIHEPGVISAGATKRFSMNKLACIEFKNPLKYEKRKSIKVFFESEMPFPEISKIYVTVSKPQKFVDTLMNRLPISDRQGVSGPE